MRRLVGLGLAGMLLLSSGCGSDGPELAMVTGRVTFQGQPVQGGTLEFVPAAGGRPSMAVTDETGTYEIMYTHQKRGAMLGKHAIRFQLNNSPGPVSEEDQMQPPSSSRKLPKDVNLHPKDVEVSSGSNQIDFELK